MNIVILSGAGISAESGLKTFRANDGLWENFSLEEVCSPQGWRDDPSKVLAFYNDRRRQVLASKPNAGHLALRNLESNHSVTVITQNIDDLHERAGSSNVLHLHGEILKAQSSQNPALCIPCYDDQKVGDLCPLGSQLRPHVVFFGEEVPKLNIASEIVKKAEILIIVGTSLVVYPAAGLIEYAPEHCQIYLIDPEPPILPKNVHPTILAGSASVQLPLLAAELNHPPR